MSDTVKECHACKYPHIPGWALSSNRLMGICCRMGSHFHDWIDYNGVAFSTELLEWGRMFSKFCGKNTVLASREFRY